MAKAATPTTATPTTKVAAPKKATPVRVTSAPKPKSTAAAKETPIRDQFAATGATIKSEASKKAAALKADANNLAGEAKVKARAAATRGKDKAAEAVGSLAKMLEDSAGTVDSKFGKQYGDYARSAASTVAGLATTLDKKDLDELATATKDLVKKNPAVSVGAAAVLGFVLARLLKGSGGD